MDNSNDKEYSEKAKVASNKQENRSHSSLSMQQSSMNASIKSGIIDSIM